MSEPFVIPRADDDEAALVGAVILEPSVLAEVRSFLAPAHFAIPDARDLFEVICTMKDQGQPIDTLTAAEAFAMRRGDKAVMIAARDMAASCPVPANAIAYAERVREAADRRHGIEVLNEAMHGVANGSPLAEAVAMVREIGPNTDELAQHVRPIGYLESLERIEAEPREWLVDGLWPQGSYGVLAAEAKAGKTWAAQDLAVSVATGCPWLGHFATRQAGVLYLYGEGGLESFWRRAEAIAKARDAPLLAMDGALRVIPQPFDVQGADTLGELAAELEGVGLVILDPWYLFAGEAKGSDLYGMGRALRGLQVTCQMEGAALLVVHHWNRTGTGTGASRISGVGPGEWGRVLISASVTRRATVNQESDVLLRFELTGGDVLEHAFTVRRRVKATSDAPWSLLEYRVEVEEAAPETEASTLSPRGDRLLRAFGNLGTGEWTRRQLGDAMARDATGKPPLRTDTFTRAAKDLLADGLIDGNRENGYEALWCLTEAGKRMADSLYGLQASEPGVR